MIKENVIKSKSFKFAIEIVKLSNTLNEKNQFVLSKQILRSGTSIGASIRESEYSESKKDFIHKMSIALKEANETLYWLELLFESAIIQNTVFDKLQSDVVEIIKILTKILNTSKS